MADDSSGEERVTIDARTLSNLNPEVLARLRSEFGIAVEIKSTKPGLTALLDSLTKGGSVAGVGAEAAYDRGFDRTSPGYDKFYDRDRGSLTVADQITNPGIDISALNKLIRR